MPKIVQYGVNWSIKDKEVSIFQTRACELEKAMNGETASPTNGERLEAMLSDPKGGNIEYFQASARLAVNLCLEGVISGLDLAKADEVAGTSITLAGKVAGKPFKMVIYPDEYSDVVIFYRDGSSENLFDWIMNRPHSAELDQAVADIRALLAPPSGRGSNAD